MHPLVPACPILQWALPPATFGGATLLVIIDWVCVFGARRKQHNFDRQALILLHNLLKHPMPGSGPGGRGISSSSMLLQTHRAATALGS